MFTGSGMSACSGRTTLCHSSVFITARWPFVTVSLDTRSTRVGVGGVTGFLFLFLICLPLTLVELEKSIFEYIEKEAHRPACYTYPILCQIPELLS